MNGDVSEVGAMDVSVKRSAAEFCTNVIARSDDRATTMNSDDDGWRWRNVRTHHGASYRPDGEATTERRPARIVEMTFIIV
jgi:hypothetical protein